MTKELLEQYPHLVAELAERQEELRNAGKGDSLIDNDVINDYRTGYPIAQAVVGPDWKKLSEKVKEITEQIDRVSAQKEEIEQFINGIEDSQLRRIFKKRYIEGKKEKRVAKEVDLERSTVSKKITNYLKLSHKSQKSHV